MIDAFVSAIDGILAVLGEDAVLRGEVVDPPRKVNVAQNVEMYDREGNLMYAEYVGTFANRDMPAKGNSLVIGQQSFVLESIVDNNGYATRFILRQTISNSP